MERNINLLIEHQCPQCGAPAILTETDRLFQCEFCRVRSYLAAKGHFRYVLPHAAPPDKDLVYFPYWRFKGMLFWCLPDGIEHRFVDLSQQAVNAPAFPPSLGLRSQAMKLKFVTPDTPGRFITPTLKFQAAMESFNNRFNSGRTEPVAHHAQIGETISIIYAPHYLDGKLYDAVLNEPLPLSLPDGFDTDKLVGKHPGGNIHFIPTLCPNCGWDMDGQRDSLSLHCSNCRTIWWSCRQQLKQLTVSHLPEPGDSIMYLPFWRIKAAVSGLTLLSYADLARLANLPKAIRPEWEDASLYFWGPAFKVRPQNYLQLFANVTISQPLEKLTAGVPDGRLYSVTMPIQEAFESLILSLASLARPRREFADKIQQLRIVPETYRLAYLPFQESHHEFIQPRMTLAVNKNQLALAKNI